MGNDRQKSSNKSTTSTLPLALDRLSEEPLVSVLVCNYNYGRFLEEALQSVARQTYRRFEVVVCDDGSTDDSRSVLARLRREWSWLEVIEQPNRGQGAALNRAYEKSSGSIVALLDSDDVFTPRKLERVVDMFRRPSVGMVHHPLMKIDASGRHLSPIPLVGELERGWLRERIVERGGRWRCSITSGIVLRREISDQLFPVDEHRFPRSVDGFLCAAVPFLTAVGAIDEPLSLYRVHGGNIGAFLTIDSNFVAGQLEHMSNVIEATNERLADLGRDGRLDPSRSAYVKELTFVHRLLSVPGSSRRAAWKELLEVRESLGREAMLTGRERALTILMYGIASALPAGLRSRWLTTARSLPMKLPRLPTFR